MLVLVLIKLVPLSFHVASGLLSLFLLSVDETGFSYIDSFVTFSLITNAVMIVVHLFDVIKGILAIREGR